MKPSTWCRYSQQNSHITDIQDNVLDLKITQETQQQQYIPVYKWAKDINRQFSKDELQIAKTHKKKMFLFYIYQ